MRSKTSHLIALAPGAIASLLCAGAMAERNRDFCEQFALFAQDLGDGVREITLLTEYSAQPTVACRLRREDAVAQRFCDWLVEHASIEYMEVNVWNAIACVTDAELSAYPIGRVDFMSGELRGGVNIAGGQRVYFELEYTVHHQREPDMLRVSVSQTPP